MRLTDSGLGCRHWPGCQAGHPLPAKSAHAFVEFGNRLVGAVTIAITLIVWLAARRTPEPAAPGCHVSALADVPRHARAGADRPARDRVATCAGPS